MSIMQDYEELRNIIGHKKYDAIEEYVETFGNIKEYDEGVKKLRDIKDINKWEDEMQKLHKKCKPIFIEDVAMNKEDEFQVRFYDEDEIRDLIKSNAELFYVDDGVDEAIIKFEDIPDFIVDYNRNFEMRNLKFFKVGKGVYEPDITTMGEYLDKINPDLRERMIDRLIALQTNESEIKKYKIIDEDVYANVEIKMAHEEMKKQKKIKNREAR